MHMLTFTIVLNLSTPYDEICIHAMHEVVKFIINKGYPFIIGG